MHTKFDIYVFITLDTVVNLISFSSGSRFMKIKQGFFKLTYFFMKFIGNFESVLHTIIYKLHGLSMNIKI